MVHIAVLLGMLTALSIPTDLRGQEPSTEGTRAWMSVGLGGGILSSMDGEAHDPGIALVAALVLREDRHRFALRGSILAEFLEDDIMDLGILYGRAWTGERSERSLSAGVAMVRGHDCDGIFSGPCDPSNTVGLPLSATISFRPSGFLGLGLELFANLNGLSSFVGLSGMLELGALR